MRWETESLSGGLLFVSEVPVTNGSTVCMLDGREFRLVFYGRNGREHIYGAR